MHHGIRAIHIGITVHHGATRIAAELEQDSYIWLCHTADRQYEVKPVQVAQLLEVLLDVPLDQLTPAEAKEELINHVEGILG